MIVCENCKEDLAIEQSENTRAFPAYAVAGGLLGAVGALVTGTLLLVPVAVVAGAATDVLSRKCGICGDEIEEGEPAYNLMEELDDGVGGRSYRHAGNAQEPMSLNSQKRNPSSRPDSLKAANEAPAWPKAVDEHSLRECHDAPSRDRLVFDHVEGKLAQAEPLASESAVNLNSPEGFDEDACVDLNTREIFTLEQNPFDPGIDELSYFTDDMAADIDPVGPIDDMQIEGV